LSKKIYIIAAEPSADLHGSALLHELKKLDPDLQTIGWGGDQMAAEGHRLDVHYREASFMGFVEVVRNLPRILSLFKKTKKSILEFRPDLVLLMDYPGFNLRMARWCKEQGFTVYYYISPQVWAWKEKRVETIRRYVDELFVILPFEEPYFRSKNVHVHYYGHPLAQRIVRFQKAADFKSKNGLDDRTILALLPGSRRQEIQAMLPIFLNAAQQRPDLQAVLAGMSLHRALYERIMDREGIRIPVVYDDTYQLLAHAGLACVTSGTATLETALFGVPQLVCYKGGRLSYYIARQLIKVKYISLVNLILDRPLVPELIQDDLSAERILTGLRDLESPEINEQIRSGYRSLQDLLLQEDPSTRIAEYIHQFLGEKGG